MCDDATIDTDVLETDATEIWGDASEVMASAKDDIPALPASARGMVPGMREAPNLYQSSREALQEYYATGSEEFSNFKDLLLKTVIAYKVAEGASVAGIVSLISITGQGVDEALRNLSPEIHPWVEVF